MPNGPWNHGDFPWKPERFQQFVVDFVEQDKAWKESLHADCDNRRQEINSVKDRVLILEQDKKWYNKVFNVLWGVTGGAIVMVVEYFRNRHG